MYIQDIRSQENTGFRNYVHTVCTLMYILYTGDTRVHKFNAHSEPHAVTNCTESLCTSYN